MFLEPALTDDARFISWDWCFSGSSVRRDRTGIVVAGTGIDMLAGNQLQEPGFIYIAGHVYNHDARYPPKTLTNGTTVVDVAGTRGVALDLLNEPLGLAFDDDLNSYITERENKRVTQW